MRPRTTRTEAAQAAERITQRRAAEDDPSLAGMPDDLFGLVTYVIGNPAIAADVDERRRPRRDRPAVQHGLRQADAADALAILDYVGAWVDRYRLAAMNLGRESGWSWGDLARAAGMKDRRYAEATYTRLYGAVHAGTGKHEKNTRAARRSPTPTPPPAPPRTRAATELDRKLRQAVAALVELEDIMPAVVADDIEDLRYRLDDWPPGQPAPEEVVATVAQVVPAARSQVISDRAFGDLPDPRLEKALDDADAALSGPRRR